MNDICIRECCKKHVDYWKGIVQRLEGLIVSLETDKTFLREQNAQYHNALDPVKRFFDWLCDDSIKYIGTDVYRYGKQVRKEMIEALAINKEVMNGQ